VLLEGIVAIRSTAENWESRKQCTVTW